MGTKLGGQHGLHAPDVFVWQCTSARPWPEKRAKLSTVCTSKSRLFSICLKRQWRGPDLQHRGPDLQHGLCKFLLSTTGQTLVSPSSNLVDFSPSSSLLCTRALAYYVFPVSCTASSAKARRCAPLRILYIHT